MSLPDSVRFAFSCQNIWSIENILIPVTAPCYCTACAFIQWSWVHDGSRMENSMMERSTAKPQGSSMWRFNLKYTIAKRNGNQWLHDKSQCLKLQSMQLKELTNTFE